MVSEKEEILAKLSQSEKLQLEWRSRVSKLEEDNSRLRRAVEQSMTRLNRMSVDSDFLVDRLACFSTKFFRVILAWPCDLGASNFSILLGFNEDDSLREEFIIEIRVL